MNMPHYPLEKFKQFPTPFYYYDMDMLGDCLKKVCAATEKQANYFVHYAVKANANPGVLAAIAQAGLGADCVSGGEIKASLEAGFPASKIVFAGVGKADWEIKLGLEHDIACFNVESLPELEVINEIAAEMGRTARIAFRVNPNVDAHTHKKITTGLEENKFGIAMTDLVGAIKRAQALPHINFVGLHFHIGSQITDMQVFQSLCDRINSLQNRLEAQGITLSSINVGGGLGVDYADPDAHPVPAFDEYFNVFQQHLKLREGQLLHFELGRSLVAQMGSMVTKVLYVKHGAHKQFLIVDGGFTDLIRPALYQAHHKICNISAAGRSGDENYDVVGPICESSDVFDADVKLPESRRGDYIVLRSAGAYGEVMASSYNCRPLIKGYCSNQLLQP